MNRLLIVFVAAFVLSGCVVRHGDFTVLSDKLIDAKNFNLRDAESRGMIEGEDKSRTIFLFTNKANPSLEDAIDDALEKGDGDVMIDATVYSYGWYIPYIYGEKGWRVEGEVVKTRTES